MINEIKNKIRTLVQKYEQGKEVYRTSRFNETQVRNEFLDPLFEILGWDIRNSAGKNTNEREVLLEEPLKARFKSFFSSINGPSINTSILFKMYFKSSIYQESRQNHVESLNN